MVIVFKHVKLGITIVAPPNFVFVEGNTHLLACWAGQPFFYKLQSTMNLTELFSMWLRPCIWKAKSTLVLITIVKICFKQNLPLCNTCIMCDITPQVLYADNTPEWRTAAYSLFTGHYVNEWFSAVHEPFTIHWPVYCNEPLGHTEVKLHSESCAHGCSCMQSSASWQTCSNAHTAKVFESGRFCPIFFLSKLLVKLDITESVT